MIAMLLALGCSQTADPDAAYEVCIQALTAECRCVAESQGRTGQDAAAFVEYCQSESVMVARCEDWREEPPTIEWLGYVVTGSANCNAI